MTPTPSVVVLPRFPDADTGTGQRSLLLLDAAGRIGPVHVVLMDGSKPIETLRARADVASVTVMHSDRITPPTGRRLVQGAQRVIAPELAYRPDPDFRAALTAKIAETGAKLVIFRYARLYCAAGIETGPDLRVMVDVDDRDDQKYASRLERMTGTRPAAALAGRLASVLRMRLQHAALVWFAAGDDVWPLAPVITRVLANVPHDAPEAPPPVAEDSRTVLFVGTWKHAPNRDGVRWFLDNCWAGIRARHADAEFRIVGRGDWTTLADEFPQLDGVAYVGGVGDLACEYARARVAICPVREGGGSKIKVIEAAAHARPVVATSHALRGFAAGIVTSSQSADRPQDMIDAVCRYLADAATARADGVALQSAQAMHHSRAAALDRIVGDMSLALQPQTG